MEDYILLKCPKCGKIQEERKSSYEENLCLCLHSGGSSHPYTCTCEDHIQLIKLKNIEELKKTYEDDVEVLQKICPHPISMVSDWLQHYWAIAHSSDFQVKICRICGKEIDRLITCNECHKQFNKGQYIKGASETICFGYYCNECWNKFPEPKQMMKEKED